MGKIVFVIISYFVGSIPFSFIFPALKGVDVRKIGSGNVGGTNAIRAAGSAIGGLSMLADASKALVMVLIAYAFGMGEIWVYLIGIAAVIGHDYPVYLKFHGGKGVACTLGFIFSVKPWFGIEFVFIWLLITLSTQYVSLASMVSMFILVIETFLFGKWRFGLALLFLTLLSVYRHRSNIKRLIHGKENKMDILKSIKELFGGTKT
ncbi:glycerol-3-phosphate 1-O-acyltransferase PlsY [Mesoaciditoga lauensis]|uniref:glycerol-3-phosphate 1-O-acyltransferase PlsY n=1 Tax=Mesoaciditoga lauensis TaxID=1495039 RepID=UPI00056203CE|nr:glycerol-3-phosphate 1-O-acyltransferase PlsY [Mesoaciditoga lauensis]